MNTIDIKLAAAPSGSKTQIGSGKFDKASTGRILPVGRAFVAHARRILLNRSFEEDERILAMAEEARASETPMEIDDGVGEEPESRELLKSDPKAWKKQDHYAILGLSTLRINATDDQIRRAHRKKVLKHHPDKKAASGDSNNDSFYKCVNKAFDVLINPEKRRQFDSIDDGIEDGMPDSNAKFDTEQAFFDAWAPVYRREARFSKKKPVPMLGDMSTDRRVVDNFYNFWVAFDSWRSFEYLDTEVNEGAEGRDEKRHAEKKNKSERARRKTEDNARVRTMVETTMAQDPRIKAFRAADKAAREAKKKGKGTPGASGTATPTEDAAALKAAELKKAQDEKLAAEAEKAQSALDKKAKDAAKKNLKKVQKAITTYVQGQSYFATGTPTVKHIEATLNEIDLITTLLEATAVSELKSAVETNGKPSLVAASQQLVSGGKAKAEQFTVFA